MSRDKNPDEERSRKGLSWEDKNESSTSSLPVGTRAKHNYHRVTSAGTQVPEAERGEQEPELAKGEGP